MTVISQPALARLPLERGAEKRGAASTLRLRWVGWVLGQLDRRALLVEGSPRPDHWSTSNRVDPREFSAWLSKHLNVTGWRALLDVIRQHNEGAGERLFGHRRHQPHSCHPGHQFQVHRHPSVRHVRRSGGAGRQGACRGSVG